MGVGSGTGSEGPKMLLSCGRLELNPSVDAGGQCKTPDLSHPSESQSPDSLRTSPVRDRLPPSRINFPSLPVGHKGRQGDPISQKEPPGEKLRCGVGAGPLGTNSEGHRDLGGAPQHRYAGQMAWVIPKLHAETCYPCVGRARFLHPLWCKVISRRLVEEQWDLVLIFFFEIYLF